MCHFEHDNLQRNCDELEKILEDRYECSKRGKSLCSELTNGASVLQLLYEIEACGDALARVTSRTGYPHLEKAALGL